MLAEAEVVAHSSSFQMLEVQYFSPPTANVSVPPESISVEHSAVHTVDVTSVNAGPIEVPESPRVEGFLPSFRSGSYADIGPRRNMEDEHIRVDDLSMHLGPPSRFPQPSALYGVFDGHGGPEASSFVKENIIKFLFEDSDFPMSSEVDEKFIVEVVNSIQRAYLRADRALADDPRVKSSTGTTAVTAFIFGRLLMVANVGDSRAVLCRKGVAINVSLDHRPSNISERRRVEQLGAYVQQGYLNGVLSVTRALGDWDIKLHGPGGSSGASPLIPDPEFSELMLTEEDEFLIIGCDGIWDVMTSQRAVNIVRKGLGKHDNPDQSAKDIVKECLRLGARDNLTVVVVSLLGPERRALLSPSSRQRKLISFSRFSFKSLLDVGRSR